MDAENEAKRALPFTEAVAPEKSRFPTASLGLTVQAKSILSMCDFIVNL